MTFSIQCETCGFNNEITRHNSQPMIQVEITEGVDPAVGTNLMLICPQCRNRLHLTSSTDFTVINKSLSLRQITIDENR